MGNVILGINGKSYIVRATTSSLLDIIHSVLDTSSGTCNYIHDCKITMKSLSLLDSKIFNQKKTRKKLSFEDS